MQNFSFLVLFYRVEKPWMKQHFSGSENLWGSKNLRGGGVGRDIIYAIGGYR